MGAISRILLCGREGPEEKSDQAVSRHIHTDPLDSLGSATDTCFYKIDFMSLLHKLSVFLSVLVSVKHSVCVYKCVCVCVSVCVYI